MLLIADSGSTKTDWLLISDNDEMHIESPGINPFFQDAKEIHAILYPIFSEVSTGKITQVHFYGAGCIKGKTDMAVTEALEQIFGNASILVNDDMLGAARAVLGNTTGIACILGTGANSCLYDGNKIVDKVPTLGFILGDEGSGAHIGKLFLNDYFKRAIPADLQKKIERDLNPDMPEILSAVYKHEYPNRFLAAYSQFLSKHKKHIYIQNLIKRSFTEFCFRNIERYEQHKNLAVSFVGSIAYHYADLLKEVAFDRGITVGKIIKKPIDGLKHFHITNI